MVSNRDMAHSELDLSVSELGNALLQEAGLCVDRFCISSQQLSALPEHQLHSLGLSRQASARALHLEHYYHGVDARP